MTIIVRDKVNNLIMLKTKSWNDVWNLMRSYLHPVTIELRER